MGQTMASRDRDDEKPVVLSHQKPAPQAYYRDQSMLLGAQAAA